MGQNTPHKKLEKLPLKRDLFETLKVLKADSNASRVLGELKGIAQTMPNQAMLINAVVLQEAKDSSEIENIITTQDQLYKALATSQSQSSNVKEVVNYRKAIFTGFDIIKKQGFIKLSDLVNIQKKLVENNAGIRKSPGTVLKNVNTGEIVYTPPQDKDEILDLLGNFLEHFNIEDKETSPLINLAILHYQFESIHPFYDGNGRTGRIMNILFLILNNLIDIPILYLSSYITTNKVDYYKLLNKVNTADEWEDWIIYILKAIETTAKETIEKINNINTLLAETIIIAKNKSPKTYKKELIKLLFEQPYSKIEYVVQRLGVERKAGSRYLKTMEGIGILTSQKIGRETIYINHKLIEILKNH